MTEKELKTDSAIVAPPSYNNNQEYLLAASYNNNQEYLLFVQLFFLYIIIEILLMETVYH
jgi:hypothetical protein